MIPTPRGGFTLIELSIVLVIIALIVGGILVGRDLIRAAEIRSVQADYEKVVSAINAFRSKYNCIPGDCPNATEFFGTDAGCPSLVGATSASPAIFSNDTPGITTCNGDGDGLLDVNNTIYEMTTLWQQLGAAQLIPGYYSGGLVGGTATTIGVNLPLIPGLAANRAGWLAIDADQSLYFTYFTGSALPLPLVPGTFGTALVIQWGSGGGVFTPAEMLNFDSKFDDGSPVKGRIMEPVAGLAGEHCTDASDENAQDAANATAQYLANDATYKNQLNCAPMYVRVW